MDSPELCPKCGFNMVASRESLKIRGVYIGVYDAMRCPICKYYYFTEKEYDLALKEAISIGIIGFSLPLRSSEISVEELILGPLYYVQKPSNDIAEIKKENISGEIKEENVSGGILETPIIPRYREKLVQTVLTTEK